MTNAFHSGQRRHQRCVVDSPKVQTGKKKYIHGIPSGAERERQIDREPDRDRQRQRQTDR